MLQVPCWQQIGKALGGPQKISPKIHGNGAYGNQRNGEVSYHFYIFLFDDFFNSLMEIESFIRRAIFRQEHFRKGVLKFLFSLFQTDTVLS